MAIACALATAHFVFEAKRRFDQFEAWLVAEPVRTQVDLSRTGLSESAFVQSCETSHGESIMLQVSSAGEDPSKLLNGLKGNIEIRRPDGTAVVERQFDGQSVGSSVWPNNELLIAYFHPFETGTYVMRLNVVEPAPRLAGRSQVVVGRYELCGLEQMPAYVTAGFAVFAGIPALIVGAVTGTNVARHGWRHANSKPSPSASTPASD